MQSEDTSVRRIERMIGRQSISDVANILYTARSRIATDMRTASSILLLALLAAALGAALYYALTKTQLSLAASPGVDASVNKEGFTAQISMKNADADAGFALIDYAVKASANSALEPSLTQVSLAQLRSVIKRGCRWLDFEVFAADHLPVVGFAPSAGATVSATTTLPLITVLEETYRSAFSTTGSPNSGDPLFVNLRVRTDDATAVYPVIQSSVSNAFGSVLYSRRVDPATTPLSALMGRAVLSLDVLYSAPELAVVCDDSIRACAAAKSLRSVAGILSGSATVPMTTFAMQKSQPPVPVMPGDPHTIEAERLRKMQFQLDDKETGDNKSEDNKDRPRLRPRLRPPSGKDGARRDTTATRFRCTIPDMARPTANPDFLSFVRSHGVQVVAMQFYKDDKNLAAYETFFNDHGQSAFVPLSTALRVATTS